MISHEQIVHTCLPPGIQVLHHFFIAVDAPKFIAASGIQERLGLTFWEGGTSNKDRIAAGGGALFGVGFYLLGRDFVFEKVIVGELLRGARDVVY